MDFGRQWVFWSLLEIIFIEILFFSFSLVQFSLLAVSCLIFFSFGHLRRTAKTGSNFVSTRVAVSGASVASLARRMRGMKGRQKKEETRCREAGVERGFASLSLAFSHALFCFVLSSIVFPLV